MENRLGVVGHQLGVVKHQSGVEHQLGAVEQLEGLVGLSQSLLILFLIQTALVVTLTQMKSMTTTRRYLSGHMFR